MNEKIRDELDRIVDTLSTRYDLKYFSMACCE